MLHFELTKDTPYLALSGELWSVFYEYLNRNWSCYKGFLLYIFPCRGIGLAAQRRQNIFKNGKLCKHSLTLYFWHNLSVTWMPGYMNCVCHALGSAFLNSRDICYRSTASFQYRLVVRSRKISIPRVPCLEFSNRSDIWQAYWQLCCRDAFGISQW